MPSPPSTRPRLLTYAIVIVAAIGAIAAVLRVGGAWYPATAALHAAAPPAGAVVWGPLTRLLVQLLVIVVATQGGGRLARRVGQPAVIGEIAAGVLLGPSLLGAVAPVAYAELFPAASLAPLSLLSQLGVILFMFTVGLAFDRGHLHQTGPTAVAVSHFSIVVPFLLGVTAALALYPGYAPGGVPFHAFALFMGIALSITAFPVLARILEERGMTRTPLGATALACAAVDDVTAWTLLAAVVALVTSDGAGTALALTLAGLAIFIAAAVWLVRPVLGRALAGRAGTTSASLLAGVLVVVLAFALTTEVIGLHALFGAFVAGAVMPPDAALRKVLAERLQAVTVFLLPAFFAFTGLRTQIGLLETSADWLICAAVIALAVTGKLGGSLVAARWTGASWRDAFVLGGLMNTRGLMELVALNVGYELGVLSPAMFTMLVVMALVTTAMTGPILDRVQRRVVTRAA